jgi:exosortase/archaeosortase family protein
VTTHEEPEDLPVKSLPPQKRNPYFVKEGTPRTRRTRLTHSLALVLGCVWVIVQEGHIRSMESSLVAWWMNGLLPGGARSLREYILIQLPHSADVHLGQNAYMGASGPEFVWLQITIECASYVVLIPFWLLAAFLISATKVVWSRWILGILAGSVGILLVNQGRIAIIVLFTNTWGMSLGYPISHVLIGSVLGLTGFAGCIFLALKIMDPRRVLANKAEPRI